MTGETYCCNFLPGQGYTGSLCAVKTDSIGFIITGMSYLSGFINYKFRNVYPNPATTILKAPVSIPQINSNVITNGKQGVYLFVFNTQEKEMIVQQLLTGTTTATLNVSDFAPGSYVAVLVEAGYKTGSQKFIKE